jgi:hypothetical protein
MSTERDAENTARTQKLDEKVTKIQDNVYKSMNQILIDIDKVESLLNEEILDKKKILVSTDNIKWHSAYLKEFVK